MERKRRKEEAAERATLRQDSLDAQKKAEEDRALQIAMRAGIPYQEINNLPAAVRANLKLSGPTLPELQNRMRNEPHETPAMVLPDGTNVPSVPRFRDAQYQATNQKAPWDRQRERKLADTQQSAATIGVTAAENQAKLFPIDEYVKLSQAMSVAANAAAAESIAAQGGIFKITDKNIATVVNRAVEQARLHPALGTLDESQTKLLRGMVADVVQDGQLRGFNANTSRISANASATRSSGSDLELSRIRDDVARQQTIVANEIAAMDKNQSAAAMRVISDEKLAEMRKNNPTAADKIVSERDQYERLKGQQRVLKTMTNKLMFNTVTPEDIKAYNSVFGNEIPATPHGAPANETPEQRKARLDALFNPKP